MRSTHVCTATQALCPACECACSRAAPCSHRDRHVRKAARYSAPHADLKRDPCRRCVRCCSAHRLRSHSCLQLAAPSRQPMLAPEFSLSSPGASPTKMMAAMRAQQQQQERQLLRSASTPTPQLSSPRFAQQQPAGKLLLCCWQRPAAGVLAAASRHRRCFVTPLLLSCKVLSCCLCACVAAGTAATSGGGAAAPPPSNRRRTGVAVSPSSSSSLAAWGDLSQAERASVARALRSSQHPGQGSADAEVHVLCSSELKTAILAFLQVCPFPACSTCLVWPQAQAGHAAHACCTHLFP